MKVLNIIGAAIVLLCSLIASFTHTLTLLRSGGLVGGLEWVVAVGVETTFLMAAANFVNATLKKRSTKLGGIKLGGVIGIGMVGWSNVSAGLAYGWTGVIIGVLIPLSLYSAKSILSDAISQPNPSPTTNQQPATNQPEPPAEEANQPTLEESQPQPEPTTNQAEESPTTSPKSPYEWAVFLHKMEGSIPTRKQLMENAECSDWMARKALAQLKQQLGA